MLAIPPLNVPQDAGQLEALINQAVAQYFLTNGPGILGQANTVVNSLTSGVINLAAYTPPLNVFGGSLRGVRMRAWGVTANNGNTKSLGPILGAASISLTANLTTSSAAAWESELIVLAAGASPSPKQIALWRLIHGTSIISVQQSTAGTEVTTAGIPVLLQAAAATTNNDIVCNGSVLELLQ